MASKLVIIGLTVLIYEVQSQAPSIGSGSSQPIQIIQPNANKCITASPQLQILPGQSNLKAVPISQLFGPPQVPNLQDQNECGIKIPRQNIQVIVPRTGPQIPSPAQCPVVQPPCNPAVITSPGSTITIPPSGVTTVIDCSIAQALANALQILIANDFINSAANNKMVNLDCLETGFDISSLIRNLNCNQLGYNSPSQSSRRNQIDECQTSCDWESLLERLRSEQCGSISDSDMAIVIDYINSQIDRSDCDKCNGYDRNYNSGYDKSCGNGYDNTYSTGYDSSYSTGYDGSCDRGYSEIEPDCNIDYSALINYLKQRSSNSQIAGCQPVQNCDAVPNYNYQPAYAPSQSCDADNAIIEALTAYLNCNTPDVCSNSYPISSTVPNVAEVYFPEEIPANLICNFGYLPTTVPVVSFCVQPVNSNCNIGVSNQCLA